MKSYRFQPHTIDHSLILREGPKASFNRKVLSRKHEELPQVRTWKWLGRVGEKLSKRLFTFETDTLKFSL